MGWAVVVEGADAAVAAACFLRRCSLNISFSKYAGSASSGLFCADDRDGTALTVLDLTERDVVDDGCIEVLFAVVGPFEVTRMALLLYILWA